MQTLHQLMNYQSTLIDELADATSEPMSLKLIRITRLKQFFTLHGVSDLSDRAKAIAKKPNQTSDLLTGAASFGERVARSIEDNAGLPMGWLDTLGDEANDVTGPVVHDHVPLLSSAQAGAFKAFVDKHLPAKSGPFEMVATTVPIRRHTFALRVMGDAMEPRFPAGMVLVIEPDLAPEPGDYVIVRTADGQTNFKQLVQDGADFLLKPLNERYPIKPLAGDTIIGVVRSAVEYRLR